MLDSTRKGPGAWEQVLPSGAPLPPVTYSPIGQPLSFKVSTNSQKSISIWGLLGPKWEPKHQNNSPGSAQVGLWPRKQDYWWINKKPAISIPQELVKQDSVCHFSHLPLQLITSYKWGISFSVGTHLQHIPKPNSGSQAFLASEAPPCGASTLTPGCSRLQIPSLAAAPPLETGKAFPAFCFSLYHLR